MEHHRDLPCLLLLLVCAFTVQGRYVHGPGHLSDELDSSIEIAERPCFTKSKTPVSCSGIGADHLMPHPDDCQLFYQCAHNQPICRECPADLHFNSVKHVCDRPENAGCANSSTDIDTTILPFTTTSWPINTIPNFNTTEPTNVTTSARDTTTAPMNTRPELNTTAMSTLTTPWTTRLWWTTIRSPNTTTGMTKTTSNSIGPQFTTPLPINTRPEFNITVHTNVTTNSSNTGHLHMSTTTRDTTTTWPINTRPQLNTTAIPTSTTPWTTRPWWTTSRPRPTKMMSNSTGPQFTTPWPINTRPDFNTTGHTNEATNSSNTESQHTTAKLWTTRPWWTTSRPSSTITGPINMTFNSTEPQFTTPWPINTRPDFNTTGPTNVTTNSSTIESLHTSTTSWPTRSWWTTSRPPIITRDPVTILVSLH